MAGKKVNIQYEKGDLDYVNIKYNLTLYVIIL